MNPNLDKLHSYPFEKLKSLKASIQPPEHLTHIGLSIGEPKHPAPAFVIHELIDNLSALENYPATKGLFELRESIASWIVARYGLTADSIDPERNVLPASGTREALFALAQAVIDSSKNPTVIMPNPFYQIYEGAALLAGAQPWYLNSIEESGFNPDFDQVPLEIWARCQLIYICTPGNPTGAVLSLDQMQKLIQLADQYDFVIASDECYSELYPDEDNPPPGLLQAAASMGRSEFERCIVFNSLSKRSNLPGLRSGFIAGDANLIDKFHLYRTYQGCAMPVPTQRASIKAWRDEKHVKQNRDLYREKFNAVLAILKPVLDVPQPAASFYLWPRVQLSDTDFAQRLYAQQNLTVLPGSYLSRAANGINPGSNRLRMALVASVEECVDAAERIARFTESL